MSNYDDTWGPFTKHARLAREEGLPDSLFQIREEIPDACQCEEWMDDLLTEYVEQSWQSNDYWIEQRSQKTLIMWVNLLFDKISDFATMINSKVSNANQKIQWERPKVHRCECENSSVLDAPVRSFFEGHFVTRNSALLIRGSASTVEAYLVPVDFLLGLSLDVLGEQIAKPALTMTIEDSTHLRITQHTLEVGSEDLIEVASVPYLARILLTELLRGEQAAAEREPYLVAPGHTQQ